MMSYQQIAREMAANSGIELTPEQVRETLVGLAAKFRALDPNLPDDDDACIEAVLDRTKII